MHPKIYARHMGNSLATLAGFPVISITGPRQSGKTTFCKQAFPGWGYVNLEDEASRSLLSSDIPGFLRNFPQGLVIDEAHLMPELFPAIQVAVDEDPSLRFVLSGSSNFLMMRQISQSLAGRVAIRRLLPLSLGELGEDADAETTDNLLWKGGFPAIWGRNLDVNTVYDGYFGTYVQRDVLQLLNIQDMNLFRKFIRLAATRVGGEFVASTLAGEVGVSYKTIQHWVSILEASYVIFLLQPYHDNLGKRITKAPKLYFVDTGLACHLLGLRSAADVKNSPLRGALFENLVVANKLKSRLNKGLDSNLYFFRDKSGNEVDLIEEEGEILHCLEIKSATNFHPEFTKGMDYFRALRGTKPTTSCVVYDGTVTWDKPVNGLVNYRRL